MLGLLVVGVPPRCRDRSSASRTCRSEDEPGAATVAAPNRDLLARHQNVCRVGAVFVQDRPHRRGGGAVAEAGRFALDSAVTPTIEQPGQGGEPAPVSGLVADRTRRLPSEDCVLVPQHERHGCGGGAGRGSPAPGAAPGAGSSGWPVADRAALAEPGHVASREEVPVPPQHCLRTHQRSEPLKRGGRESVRQCREKCSAPGENRGPALPGRGSGRVSWCRGAGISTQDSRSSAAGRRAVLADVTAERNRARERFGASVVMRSPPGRLRSPAGGGSAVPVRPTHRFHRIRRRWNPPCGAGPPPGRRRRRARSRWTARRAAPRRR